MPESQYTPNSTPPIPESQAYYEAIADTLREYEIHDSASLFAAMKQRAKKNADFRYFQAQAARVASVIEPVDYFTGHLADPERRKSKALYSGLGFAALLVPGLHAEAVQVSTVFDEQDKIEFTVDGAQNMLKLEQEVEMHILQAGWGGIDIVGDGIEAALVKVEERVVPVDEVQPFFRVGCGTIFLHGLRAHEAYLKRQAVEEYEDSKEAAARTSEPDSDAASRKRSYE